MTAQNNAARVAVQAEPCQKQAVIRWVSVLILEMPDLEPGISTSFCERLPGSFATFAEAMGAACETQRNRPDVIGVLAERVEVAA